MLSDLQRRAIHAAVLVARAELAKRAKAAREAATKNHGNWRHVLPAKK